MACRNHSHIEEGLEHCEICTETYCGDCLVDFRDRRTCGECKAQIVADLEGGLGVGGEGELPPWERRQEFGLIGAFWETTKRVTMTPTAFFATVDKRAERWDCLVYIIIVQVLVTIVMWGMIAAFLAVVAGTSADSDELREALVGTFGMLPTIIMQIVFAPFSAVLSALLYASLTHVFLVVTKTNTRSWHQTLRHWCYARAPSLIAVLPLPPLTWLVSGIWTIVTTVIMVKRVHGTTTGTAVAAVLWIVVLCCFCAGALGLGIALLAASGGG